ncbi:MAG: hypothetical protein IKK76_01195 [Alphaproteobacteria bacterium]|nr:hypothetical protein [Alphaproteobacteria bacterium]
MAITYDKKRTDITFCTMLFQIPRNNLNSLKHMDRKFEEFYLPNLKKLIETFGRIALWCDDTTAKYLRKHGLDKNINMRVMRFNQLPHTGERNLWLKTMHGMRKYVGYFLHNKTPEQWIDYMMIINAKPAVMEWAATNNKFNSKYFMWIDAGATNPMYAACWENWDGHIYAKPKNRVRITIARTLGKSRPHFVPRFIYNIFRTNPKHIPYATRETLIRQNLRDIAMINADYDVPACSMLMSCDMVHKFYNAFERTRKIMLRHNLVSTEQAVFQAMMKFDTEQMFELSYIYGYSGVYAAVAKKDPDHILE